MPADAARRCGRPRRSCGSSREQRRDDLVAAGACRPGCPRRRAPAPARAAACIGSARPGRSRRKPPAACVEPLADVALAAAGLLARAGRRSAARRRPSPCTGRARRRGSRAARSQRGAEFAHHLAHEGVQPGFVDLHDGAPCGRDRSSRVHGRCLQPRSLAGVAGASVRAASSPGHTQPCVTRHRQASRLEVALEHADVHERRRRPSSATAPRLLKRTS